MILPLKATFSEYSKYTFKSNLDEFRETDTNRGVGGYYWDLPEGIFKQI